MDYEIVDLRSEDATPVAVSGRFTAEEAASRALNMKLVRAGHPRRLVCKAYWSEAGGQRNMVRLYQPVST